MHTLERGFMDAIVVDIDDTIVGTDRRRQAAWCRVLGRDVSLQEVESQSSLEILRKYAFSDANTWKRFWMLTLCVEPDGADLLELDTPLPYAAAVLQKWSNNFKLVYFTGRTKNMRRLTLDELRRFEFPTDEAELEMFALQNWMSYFAAKTTVVEIRSILFSKLSKRHNVVRVIDDYPGFFEAYRRHPVPDKVGLLRKKRFSPQEYLDKGATRVVESWKQLLEY
jgi:hypothetical protein